MLIKDSAKSDSEFSAEITSVTFKFMDSIKKIETECGLSPWKIEDYILELTRNDSIFLLAKYKNSVAAFLLARLIMTDDNKIIKNEKETITETYKEAEIYNIAVKNEFQRKRIGQTILNYFLRQVESLGVSSVWLEVRESNHSAVDFYCKNGFKKSYTRKNFYNAPVENGIVMKLDLPL